MIDTGRRFYPVELVESLLEGMSMMKLNVMHMFLSECECFPSSQWEVSHTSSLCAVHMFLSVCFRVESKIFPDLVNNGGRNCTGPNPRPGLVNNGFYSQAQISR